MSTPTSILPTEEIDYPDSDGQPMAENTLQFMWIVTIQGGLDALFRDNPDVFVAGDLLWYPLQGSNTIRMAPDALVVFGRPKGYRGSYMQWREGGIAPQVVWEVHSPGNRAGELDDKFEFYRRYGVEEYYQYDPDRGRLRGWLRDGQQLREIVPIEGWTSPRLGVRLEMDGDELVIYRPDGQHFQTYVESESNRQVAEARAAQERQRAEQADQRAEQADQRAEQERQQRQAALTLARQERQQREAAQAQTEQERQQRQAAQAQAEQERQQRQAAQAQTEQERQQRQAAQAQAKQERQQRQAAQAQAEQERQRAEHADQRAEQERQQREAAQTQAEQERQRAEQLTAKLRALGIDPKA